MPATPRGRLVERPVNSAPEPFPGRRRCEYRGGMPAAGAPIPPGAGTDPDKPIKVLVVEDEQSVAEALGFLLRLDGFSVEWATTGPLALRLFDIFEPDLVLLDLMLPGLDGLDVCRRLRRRTDVPIIMVTARDSAADRSRGLQAGADDYVTKPYSVPELRETIHAALARRSAGSVVDLRSAPEPSQAGSAGPAPPGPQRRAERWPGLRSLTKRRR